MSRVKHAQGVCVWVTRNNDVASACKQNARGIGKAQAGKCRAWARNGHAQVGAWCAQARKHTRTQRVLLTLVFGNVCGGAGCVWNMYSAQSKESAGGLCLDHPGCGLSAQVGSMLVEYSSGFWFSPYRSFVLQLPAGVLAGCRMCACCGWLRCWCARVTAGFLQTRRGAEQASMPSGGRGRRSGSNGVRCLMGFRPHRLQVCRAHFTFSAAQLASRNASNATLNTRPISHTRRSLHCPIFDGSTLGLTWFSEKTKILG